MKRKQHFFFHFIFIHILGTKWWLHLPLSLFLFFWAFQSIKFNQVSEFTISITIKILNISKISFFPANKRCYHCVESVPILDSSFTKAYDSFPKCTPVKHKHSQQKWNQTVDCSETDRYCATELIMIDSKTTTSTKNIVFREYRLKKKNRIKYKAPGFTLDVTSKANSACGSDTPAHAFVMGTFVMDAMGLTSILRVMRIIVDSNLVKKY